MLITALAGLTLANISLASAATGTTNVQGKSRVLVAYFSRSGNTRVITGVIHRSLNTDLFEIEPATPYPEDYFQTVEQAKNERERGVKPALKNSVADIARYETVYLGFPIWGTSVPPVVQAFLSNHNFAGKLLIPFITHGGYGKETATTSLPVSPQLRVGKNRWLLNATRSEEQLKRLPVG
ncbi:flavodoxin [Candidatus Erwinia dacicola]|nr:flavodoxin [Candidatus Erwinia dacicola]